MSHRKFLTFVFAAVLIVPAAGFARADQAPEAIRALHERVSPSLVAVEYTWAYEFGRIEFVCPGIVVRDDGLVMTPLAVIGPLIPDVQLVDFKIIIPSREKDEEEIDAVFQGRDERTQQAFILPKDTGRKWAAVQFEEISPKLGDTVASIGMLPKDAGYTTYYAQGTVAGFLRGEQPAWLVTNGGLAACGGPVFNTDGKAIGVIMPQPPQQVFLSTSSERRNQQINTLAPINVPPCLFQPTSDFIQGLKDPPTPDKPIRLPWLGIPGLTGLEKDVAEAFGLENQPAIEVGDVIPGTPADKAGLKVGMKIVKLNGQPLERGDQPEELPVILSRNIRKMSPGTEITLSVLTEKGQPLQDIKVSLEQRPKRPHEFRRFWAEDLAFSVRDISFEDAYARKQPSDMKGVVVAIVKREGPAAAARLEIGDIITSLNGVEVADSRQFEADFKSLRKDKPREAAVLVVLKPDATTKTVKIEPPQ